MSNERLREFATSIVQRLTSAGFRAVFAGGCVRDMLRGEAPKDYDVATSATPEQIMALFSRTVPVGVAFGVVRVLSPGDAPLQVEVATFRGETTYSDGRHPDQVCFTDEVEDVKRRDFTVNGLLFDPLKNEVLDYVDGRRDLERKLIRAIGDPKRRFAEDHLRMLRAIRFAARLDFEIDGATFGAIKDNAEKILSISAERIRDELSLMLTGPHPRRAFELLKQSRLLKHILPEIDALEGVPQPPQFHPEGDVWTHTLMLLGQLENAPLTLALGALLHDVGKPRTFEITDRIRFNEHERVGAVMTEEILRRLRYSNEEIERVTSLVRQHMAFKDVTRMRKATLKRFLRMPHFDEHLTLHKLDCNASHGDLSLYDFCHEELARQKPDELRPSPLLSGADLIALGLRPGPEFKKILTEVEDRQLEGSLTDRESALRYVREQLIKR
ncbi:MAG TPA: CCA tRNA nucleotidyltransferase [Planctomycetota bacterium]|nr:CCA tRNA nucleotidyltransferase [Planctomycetota bacterium]